MIKEDSARFSLYWKEARADFLFQREKRIFLCFLITFESLWRSRWFFFFGSIEQQKRDFTSEIWASRIMKKTKKNWNLESLEKARADKNNWVILFLCTVKNNDRKFVEFALRKSIFFFILMFAWKLTELQKIQSFFMKISEDPVKPSKFPHEHQYEQKLWFSQCEIHKFSVIIFHSVEAEIFRELANYHLAIPGLSSIKIFFDSLCEWRSWSKRAGLYLACQIDAIFGN